MTAPEIAELLHSTAARMGHPLPREFCEHMARRIAQPVGKELEALPPGAVAQLHRARYVDHPIPDEPA